MEDVSVLHVSPVWLPQTQTWLHSQVVQSMRFGIENHVVCERAENPEQFRVENLHCLADESAWARLIDNGLRKLRFRQYLDFVVRTGRAVDSRIVHSHFGNVGWSNLGAVRRIGAKHVVTFYGLDVNKLPVQSPIWRGRYLELFADVDLVLCEGSHMASSIARLGCPLDRVAVHHLGVDIRRIAFRPRRFNQGERLRVLIASSFREKKGIPDAIRALGELRGEVGIDLTIIGDAAPNAESEQREKRRIIAELDSAGLRGQSHLLGYQTHAVMLEQAYAHHVFLHPSLTANDGDTEGGAPVSLIEMLASGMPVVSTTHCDIPEVMGPSLRHLLAPEKDATALANRIRWLITNPDQWESIARVGRLRVEAEYDAERQAMQLADMYRRIVTT